ncbi:unnamed protein product, partial [Mesorhabditis belari]|uniref:rhomboid protease n=1 Tax=Mesorhabditis belari TaxID=2138241 RepID=A0AAF3EQF1_9BILA
MACIVKFSVSIGAFTLAAVWDEKRRQKFHEEAESIVRKFYQEAQRMGSPDKEPEFELSPGMKCALFLVVANCTQQLCSPMLLSAFSHSSLLHLGINMYVLWTFASVSIDKFLGVPQFCAMYASASVVSSLTSLMHKSAIRSPIRALGASGAILGLLAYTCCKIPEARLHIVFLPFFDFSAQSAIIGVILFDLAGLLFGFKLFDHLGGALFGVAYAQYGEEFWKRYSPTIGKWLN